MASPGVLEDVAGPAADPDPGDEGEDDVLRADTRGQPALDPDLVGLRVALEEGLGGEDHLDLAGPDPERERPERPVGARVRVAAHDRHPGLGQPELRADDVDDALGGVADAVERDPELGAVGLELVDLGERHLVDERQAAIGRRDGMVRGGHGLARPADADPARAQTGEGLRAGDLMDQVQVHGEDGRGARVLGDDVVGPDLVDDRSRGGGRHVASVPEGARAGRGHRKSGPKAALPASLGRVGGDPPRSQSQRRPADGPGRCASWCGTPVGATGMKPVTTT